MIALFFTVVEDPDLVTILRQVEGSVAAWHLEIRPQHWLIGCVSLDRDPASFERDCRQALADAERVRDMLADVELKWL